MATILQKMFFSSKQCAVLDFINEHRDSVVYFKTPVMDSMDTQVQIGTKHNVIIETNNMILSAKLTKYAPSYPFRDNEVSYSFRDKPAGASSVSISERSNFASRVYKSMLDNYILKNGCPVRM